MRIDVNKFDFDRAGNIDLNKVMEIFEFAEKYGLEKNFVYLFYGRPGITKGVEYLIKAAKQIKAEVVIAGDGPERKYLESLILKFKFDLKFIN